MGQLTARSLIITSLLFLQASAQTKPSQAPTTSGQKPGSKTGSAPVLRVTTRLVTIDVVATDNHGKVVVDLKPEDFNVMEDGKRQDIRVFTFHQPPVARGVRTAKKLNLPPNVFTNTPAYSSNNSLNVIVLDLLNTDFMDQAYGRNQILKYLSTIPDDEPATVAVYTMGRKLRLVQDFTNDFAALKKAIHALKNERYADHDNLAEGISPDNKDLVVAPPKPIKEFSQTYEGAQQLDRRVEYTLEGLYTLARNLAGYPGRKNLIWISTTFPIGVGPDAELGPNEFEGLRSYEQAIIAVSQALVDAQIAVYPVDPRGPLSPELYGGHGTAPADQIISLTREAGSGVPEQNTMQQMAQLTGGKAYFNQNDINEAIRNSIADGSTYYTLAYYPDNKAWSGEFRKLTVKVDRAGVKLRYRPGYYALNAGAALDDQKKFGAFGRALKPDSPLATGLRFEVGVVQPSEKTQNKLLLNFALDPRAITFEQQDDGLQHALVDCAVQAYSEQGQLKKMDANTLSVALDKDAFNKAMQTYLLAHVTIDLSPGPYVLRFGVIDEHSGLIGTADAKILVAAPQTVDDHGVEPENTERIRFRAKQKQGSPAVFRLDITREAA